VSNTEQEIKDSNIRLCLDCGKCTVVCPVAQHDADFNPRLIAQRRLAQNSNSLQDETIWECLSCYMCVERCNYRVKFPEFIRALRTDALSKGVDLHCSHGGALQSLMHIMTREDLHQSRLDWLPEDIELSGDSDTIFFVGCAPYFDVIFSDLGVNTIDGVKGAIKLLNRAEIPFNVLANERCCGRDLLLQGDREGFLALAKANMEEFTEHGVKKIITNCPECYHTLKVDYPDILGSTGIEVVHITEAIAPILQNNEFTFNQIDKKATYQDPCTLGRCSRIFEQPREMLGALTGLELVEMEQNREKALCCGAAPWVQCGSVNKQIQAQRLTQAADTGADILVTACPKCQIHLKCAQKSSEGAISQIEIRDLSGLLGQSLELGGEQVG